MFPLPGIERRVAFGFVTCTDIDRWWSGGPTFGTGPEESDSELEELLTHIVNIVRHALFTETLAEFEHTFDFERDLDIASRVQKVLSPSLTTPAKKLEEIKHLFNSILYDKLEQLKPGESDWDKYQDWVARAMSWLFARDLALIPIQQLTVVKTKTDMRATIRDEAREPWAAIRDHYGYRTVIEAKNIARSIEADEVRQVVGYLDEAPATFVILCCRRRDRTMTGYFKDKVVVEHGKERGIRVFDDEDFKRLLTANVNEDEFLYVVDELLQRIP